ncbi:MAG: zinc-binding dehydrogenase [Chloroflexi bacterium]|nr:zinc-binding dehydrogenase [Chloroflexota bacterium]
MKTAVIEGERKAALVDVPDLAPREDWAVVKIYAAPMCTEYKSFVSGHVSGNLGHEAAGEVVATAQPGRVKPGDRVVVMPLYACGHCDLCIAGDYIHCEQGHDFQAFSGFADGSGTMAEYILKPSYLLPRIPDDVSYERASLACCALGASFGAFELMGVDAFSTVLVTGLGPVGLGAVVNARFRGATVIGVDPTPERADRARKMGATVIDPREPGVLEQIRSLTGGKGVDRAIDCSGTIPAQRLCLRQPGSYPQGTYGDGIVAL